MEVVVCVVCAVVVVVVFVVVAVVVAVFVDVEVVVIVVVLLQDAKTNDITMRKVSNPQIIPLFILPCLNLLFNNWLFQNVCLCSI